MRKGHGQASLYRLIYCSRNAIPPGADTVRDAIGAILSASRARNEAAGVTGALLFTGSGFAQVLEGPREIVERTFDRIGADPRHCDVSVLTFTPTERRAFPDWPLGFCGQVLDGAADPLAGLLPDQGAPVRRVTTGSDVLRLLEGLVRHEDQWTAA